MAGLGGGEACAAGLPQVVVEARLQADGRIAGTLRGPADLELADPLAPLPMPQDDLQLFRTFPGAPDRGELELRAAGPGAWAFRTRLPRRFGATGALPGRGVWANGGWLPQPVEEGRLREVCWIASVDLPDGLVGALNDAVGRGTLRWSGAADRLALAALRRGRIVELGAGLALLADGPPRPRRDALLRRVYEEAWPQGVARRPVVVVVGPQYRRLVRPGPGILFLSERAFRLTGPLGRYHRLPVARGLLAAALPVQDRFARELAAEVLARNWAAARRVRNPRGLLSRAAWLPQVDDLLASGTMPFYAEVFDETWPGDPVRDALEERFGERVPARVVAAWIEDRFGAEVLQDIVADLLAGAPLEEALGAHGVDPTLVQAWRRVGGTAPENLLVEVDEDPPAVRVRREAGDDAPPVPVTLEVDGRRTVLPGAPGPWTVTLPLEESPRKVRLDPEGHLRQSDRSDDAWPRRWSVVAAAVPYAVNLTERTVAGVAWATLRPVGDTRHRTDLIVSTDEVDLLAVSARRVRYLGRLLDRRTRSQALAAWVEPAILAEAYRPTGGHALAVGGGVSWLMDERVSFRFPLSGRVGSLSASAGLVPGTTDWWGSLRGRAAWVGSPHPRWAVAAFAAGGLARSDIPHRLVGLGGTWALQSVPPGLVVGQAALLGGAELRWAPLRRLSVPLAGLAWLDEVQLSAGLEGGGVLGAWPAEGVAVPSDRYLVAGWTAGLGVVVDLLGAVPTLVGVTVARPVVQEPLLLDDPPLQVVLRAHQNF